MTIRKLKIPQCEVEKVIIRSKKKHDQCEIENEIQDHTAMSIMQQND